MRRLLAISAALAVPLATAACGSTPVAGVASQNTANVSQQTVALLQELAKDSEELGSTDSVHRAAARTDLLNLYHSADTVEKHAQSDLAATNPAQPVFVKLAEVMKATSTQLNRAGDSPRTRPVLSDLDATLTDLARVADGITTHVDPSTQRQIEHDVAEAEADVHAATAA